MLASTWARGWAVEWRTPAWPARTTTVSKACSPSSRSRAAGHGQVGLDAANAERVEQRGDAIAFQPRRRSSVQVVEAEHVVAVPQQGGGGVHADEAGGPGDEYSHDRTASRAARSRASSLACFRKPLPQPMTMCTRPATPSRKPNLRK